MVLTFQGETSYHSMIVTQCVLPCSGHSPPGQAVPKQAVGGQASTLLLKSPSEALTALAPSSQGAAAFQPHCWAQHVPTNASCGNEGLGEGREGAGEGEGMCYICTAEYGSICLLKTKANILQTTHTGLSTLPAKQLVCGEGVHDWHNKRQQQASTADSSQQSCSTQIAWASQGTAGSPDVGVWLVAQAV